MLDVARALLRRPHRRGVHRPGGEPEAQRPPPPPQRTTRAGASTSTPGRSSPQLASGTADRRRTRRASTRRPTFAGDRRACGIPPHDRGARGRHARSTRTPSGLRLPGTRSRTRSIIEPRSKPPASRLPGSPRQGRTRTWRVGFSSLRDRAMRRPTTSSPTCSASSPAMTPGPYLHIGGDESLATSARGLRRVHRAGDLPRRRPRRRSR